MQRSLEEQAQVFPILSRRKDSSVGTSAGRQRAGQKTGKMLPIKMIIEISNAVISHEGKCLTGAGSGFCVADDMTYWLGVPLTGLGQLFC